MKNKINKQISKILNTLFKKINNDEIVDDEIVNDCINLQDILNCQTEEEFKIREEFYKQIPITEFIEQ